ncbi:MAG TPA: bifunctional phosphoserine phosphatase/homoserine phosphotransferase ThrH [Myxococcota bacterium]|nr:bifunctional phosphoserine phosphatase/homoserine phosphotransferase ThrH [Myxococcota bacterium]
MIVACLDLEGVLVPEIWIAFSERVGIPELRRTTRDEPDYDKLMKWRIALLTDKGFALRDIQRVIAGMAPLPGAREFLDWLRERMQVVILSDTFNQFAQPLMRQLGWPTLLCHDLITDDAGQITGYRLRQPDAKREAVLALRGLNLRTIAAGDSYNDTRMLAVADRGVLFRPPENVIREFPEFPVTRDYEELRAAFARAEKELT